MANYKLVHSEPAPRVELHEALGLTGAEVSINTVPPNGGVPFVHVHTNNEELYIVLEGKGELWIDGETLPIQAGDSFRIDPRRGGFLSQIHLHPDEGSQPRRLHDDGREARGRQGALDEVIRLCREAEKRQKRQILVNGICLFRYSDALI